MISAVGACHKLPGLASTSARKNVSLDPPSVVIQHAANPIGFPEIRGLVMELCKDLEESEQLSLS